MVVHVLGGHSKFINRTLCGTLCIHVLICSSVLHREASLNGSLSTMLDARARLKEEALRRLALCSARRSSQPGSGEQLFSLAGLLSPTPTWTWTSSPRSPRSPRTRPRSTRSSPPSWTSIIRQVPRRQGHSRCAAIHAGAAAAIVGLGFVCRGALVRKRVVCSSTSVSL